METIFRGRTRGSLQKTAAWEVEPADKKSQGSPPHPLSGASFFFGKVRAGSVTLIAMGCTCFCVTVALHSTLTY